MHAPPELESSSATTRYDKAGVPFHVRLFQPADRPMLEDFYDQFEPPRAAQGLPPKGRERISKWLDSILNRGVHLVAERGAVLIGHAFVVPYVQPGSGEYAVFLKHTERGKGMGTELNRVAVDAARAAGYRSLWLSVEPYNRAAIRSYERAGFRFRPGTVFSPEVEMTIDLRT